MDAKPRMRPPQLTLILNATPCLASAATAQLSTSTSPQHTAIYTTTLANNASPHAVATVIVTLLMPREQPGYPKDGAQVTGTAVSQFSATQANGAVSTWTAAAELLWTLSGNVPLGVDSTIPPPPEGAKTTLTSVYTTTDYHVSDIYGMWISRARYEWFTTLRVTLVEAVGTAYPATIIRTGYTHVDATMMGGNLALSTRYSETATASYWRTTTMVQVAATPRG